MLTKPVLPPGYYTVKAWHPDDCYHSSSHCRPGTIVYLTKALDLREDGTAVGYLFMFDEVTCIWRWTCVYRAWLRPLRGMRLSTFTAAHPQAPTFEEVPHV
ncbi:hypothetical protein [Methylocaldum sp.]|uniref:hypothetical protein n=1 Tax=Methylocaldum sp. TaxID=1969727 RepID=UPI002D63E962|nr:hypothetical protein [Methylocaldum sp.]HYE38132.1 hypothetical protein [Methylocaldum sp.]